MSVITALACSW